MIKFPGVELIRHYKHSDEWFEFRKNGIGGSEIGAVMGLNPYESKWNIWEEKVGLRPADRELREKMLHGIWLEDYIADCWKFWDNKLTDEIPDWINRYNEFNELRENKKKPDKAKYIMRNNERINAILRNEDIPWIFVNLDRAAAPGQFMADFTTICETPFPVECKGMGGFIAKEYEHGIPAYYHGQAQTQMMVCKVKYAEFCVLQDGNYLRVHGFHGDPDFQQTIVEVTHDFWYNKVLPAREMLEQIRELDKNPANYEKVADMFIELRSKYEPAAENTVEYYSYLTERYQMEYSGINKIQGPPEAFEKAKLYKVWQELKKHAESNMDEIKAEITSSMRNSRFNIFDYGEDGKIMWVPDKGRDVPSFRNLIKWKVEGDLLRDIQSIRIDL